MISIEEILNDIKGKTFHQMSVKFVQQTKWKCDYCDNLCYGTFYDESLDEEEQGYDCDDICKECYDKVINQMEEDLGIDKHIPIQITDNDIADERKWYEEELIKKWNKVHLKESI